MAKRVFASFPLLCAVALLASPVTSSVAPGQAGQTAKMSFDREIAPLLAQNCLDCHSGAKPKWRLDLTQQKTALKGGKSGPALVPGMLDRSALWERVDAGEMPPKHPLGAAEKRKLREWIAAGAVWGSDPIDPFGTRFDAPTRLLAQRLAVLVCAAGTKGDKGRLPSD